MSEAEQRISELEKELAEAAREQEVLQAALIEANQELGVQREMIREHALNAAPRDLDALLTLFPSTFPAGNWEWSERDFEDCWFEAADGIRLHGWLLSQPEPQAVILFAHGNAGNVTHRAAVAAFMWERYNATVLVFDYRGYGRSEGVPTLNGLVLDAQAARNYLAARSHVAPEDVVLMGRSMGGAVVTQVAAQLEPRALILQSTFTSLREVAALHANPLLANLLLSKRFQTAETLRLIHCPVLLSHGTRDRTIPYSHGEALFAVANEPKRFLAIADADHNDRQDEAYWTALEEFLQGLSHPSR